MRSTLDACVFWVVLRFEYASKLVVNAAWAFFKQCDRKHQLKKSQEWAHLRYFQTQLINDTCNMKLHTENKPVIWKPGINWQTFCVSNLRLNGWVRRGLMTADILITRFVTSEWSLLHIRCWLAAVRYISEVCNLHNCQRGTCHCLVLSFKGKHCFVLKWNRSKQEHQGESSKGRNTKNTVCMYSHLLCLCSERFRRWFVCLLFGGFWVSCICQSQ